MDKYWIASSSDVFDSTDNWSLTSGGSPGAPVPGLSDTAIFDGSGQGTCGFNIPLTVGGINVQADYSGALIQQLHSINVANDATFSGGVFSGSSAPITINGSLFINSTTRFVSTSGTLTLYGLFQYNPSATILPISEEDMITEEYTLQDVDVTSQGILLRNIPRIPEEVALSIVGGVPQDYGIDYYYDGLLKWDGMRLAPDIEVGDIFQVSYPPDSTVQGNFFHNYGTFRAMTDSSAILRPNGARFYDLMVDNDMTPAGYRVIDTSSIVEHQLLLTKGYMTCGIDGTITVLGDVCCSQDYGRWSNNSNVRVNFTSGGFQNIFTTGGILPHIYVDKTTAHQVKFFGDVPLNVDGDFYINDGTVNTNGVFLQVGAV